MPLPLGFLDSNYYLDVDPFPASGFSGFQQQTQLISDSMNGSSLAAASSPACVAAYPGQTWKCSYGQYRMPFIKTSYLMVAAQYDGWQLSHDVHDYQGIEADPVYTEDELDYVNSFGAATQALVQTLPSAVETGSALVFSPACYSHHVSETPNFWNASTSDGTSQAGAMATLLSLPEAAQYWVDDCVGYACGSGC
uniref:Uncharacterized protein n=1 Tax=Rhizochromulina marina TaxID=1034831 RepID=A0A7S2SGH9_9STRA|mmetsp:Transcript_29866/g.86987  ORF Transcript_29866/g.86987 Transcript_29866/m.86987 type:complete len:195 (+) Transcript_29866:2-586(+)